MTKRQVFYSFHYSRDAWRASQVRNMGVVEGNRPVTDNEWEEVKRKGDKAIQQWIDEQLRFRSCTVVLVGAETAERKWVQYEIVKSWNEGMGVVGIYINGLLDQNQQADIKGRNPFDFVEVGGISLSQIAKCYTPSGYISTDIYANIKVNINLWVEEAIRIREQYGKLMALKSTISTPDFSAYKSTIESLLRTKDEEINRKSTIPTPNFSAYKSTIESLLRTKDEEINRTPQESDDNFAALIEALQEQQNKKKRESEELFAALFEKLRKPMNQ